jgi:predicted metal-dependent peptidase
LHFTDGKGAWPTRAPSLPVLWVLTNDHAFDCPWGTVVRLC